MRSRNALYSPIRDRKTVMKSIIRYYLRECNAAPGEETDPMFALRYNHLESRTHLDGFALSLAIQALEESSFIRTEETDPKEEGGYEKYVYLLRKGYTYLTLAADQRRIALITFFASVIASVAASILIKLLP